MQHHGWIDALPLASFLRAFAAALARSNSSSAFLSSSLASCFSSRALACAWSFSSLSFSFIANSCCFLSKVDFKCSLNSRSFFALASACNAFLSFSFSSLAAFWSFKAFALAAALASFICCFVMVLPLSDEAASSPLGVAGLVPLLLGLLCLLRFGVPPLLLPLFEGPAAFFFLFNIFSALVNNAKNCWIFLIHQPTLIFVWQDYLFNHMEKKE